MPHSPTTRSLRSWATKIDNSHLVKFLIVGGVSFAIDLGLLVILHEAFGVGLWIATPVAFLVSLTFNYVLQRMFTFKVTTRSHSSLIRYAILVAFNTLATDFIVNTFADLELTYAAGKIVATALTMAWNFFLYKYWIFPSERISEEAKSVSVGEATPKHAGGPGASTSF